MFDYIRSHDCGALREKEIGEAVTLSGWVHRHRDHGGLIFVDLRDRYGLTQLVFDPAVDENLHHDAEKLHSEWVISIKGHVRARAEGMNNPKLSTGAVEILVDEMTILSPAKTPPFSIADEKIKVNEELRLKYRYLDLRRGPLLNNLVLRHKAMIATRKFMDTQGFLEVQTPIMAKSTPEGARDYLVPSRIYPGSFYALPQSPQIFKQLLMVSGVDRYFQIAPCFRDEDLRSERQPEHHQIDIEMSFGTANELFPILEGLISSVFKECVDVDIDKPFRQISYNTCIDRYGTDKPDLRFGMELHRLDDIAKRSDFSVFLEQISGGGAVKGLCVKGGADISRKGIDNYTSFVGQLGIKGLAWMKKQEGKLTSSIVKFFSEDLQAEIIERLGVEDGDLIFIIADELGRCNQALDHLRRKLARDRDLIKPNHYEMLWVTDFPLFSWNDDEGRLDSEHHPFTAPSLEDMHLLDEDPIKTRSSSYDLVINGHEIGSGSQRIHDPALQEKIFNILQLTEDDIEKKFGFFVEALKYGTPPHLGMGFGLDRLLMILSNTENIRDVIAFPKTQKASDLMMACPSNVEKTQLDELGVAVKEMVTS